MNLLKDDSWLEVLAGEFNKPYFARLSDFVDYEYGAKQVFPSASNLFRAFDCCPFDDVKVVVIGQDPYHGLAQADGLCFSVCDGVSFPPSLKNIFRELSSDLGVPCPLSGSLEPWARQGVLLLNSVLTVEAHVAASHAGRGWELFTDEVVRQLATRRTGVVYLLWGAYAQRKASFVDESCNLVLRSVHPSPLSAYRGFFGCRHFSLANDYLVSVGRQPIVWR